MKPLLSFDFNRLIGKTVFTLLVLACLQANALAEQKKQISPATLSMLENYFNEVKSCKYETSDSKLVLLPKFAWCSAAHVNQGRFSPPADKKVYIGISQRFFTASMSEELEGEKDFQKKWAQTTSEFERKKLIGNVALSKVSIGSPNEEFATLILGPNSSQIASMTASTPSEEKIMRCLKAELSAQLLGTESAGPIKVSPKLMEYLNYIGQNNPQYPYTAQGSAMTFQQSKLPVWLTKVQDPLAGEVYITLENDLTPKKENIYISLFPIRELVTDPQMEQTCQKMLDK